MWKWGFRGKENYGDWRGCYDLGVNVKGFEWGEGV